MFYPKINHENILREVLIKSILINHILMMSHILSSDSIRRPLFSTHPTGPEFSFENWLDLDEDYP